MIEFKKHVFPRLCNPTDPGATGTPLSDSRTKPQPLMPLLGRIISTGALPVCEKLSVAGFLSLAICSMWVPLSHISSPYKSIHRIKGGSIFNLFTES